MLSDIEEALQTEGLPVQNHSSFRGSAEKIPFLWAKALLHIWAFPEDAFELNGVLRELFGISDVEIALYVQSHLSEGQPHPLNLLEDPKGKGKVANALSILRKSARRLRGRSVVDAIREAVETLKLPDRLVSLPGISDDLAREAIRELETLGWKTQGESLSAFVESWDLEEGADHQEVFKDSLQLLSCHKAKGLEWPIVVLAGLFNGINYERKKFPFLWSSAWDEPIQWIGHSGDFSHDDCKRENTIKDRELKCLAYVAGTRAKRSLILTDDANLCQKPTSSAKVFSHVFSFEKGQANEDVWLSLKDFVPLKKSKGETDHSEKKEKKDLAPNRESFVFKFPKRILPSHLTEKVDEISDFSSLEEDSKYADFQKAGGVDYGEVWHEMMSKAPWGHLEKWEEHTRAFCKETPYQDRLLEEFQHLKKTDLFCRLNEKDTWVRPEVPFLWKGKKKDGEEIVIDGRLDLLGLLEDGKWILADWKTDRVSDPENSFIKRYGKQLGVCGLAVKSILEATPALFFYGTMAGTWVPHQWEESLDTLLH